MFVRVPRLSDLSGSSVSSIAEESFIRMQPSSVRELHSIVVFKRPIPNLHLNKSVLPVSLKFLGLILDNHLSSEPHLKWLHVKYGNLRFQKVYLAGPVAEFEQGFLSSPVLICLASFMITQVSPNFQTHAFLTTVLFVLP